VDTNRTSTLSSPQAKNFLSALHTLQNQHPDSFHNLEDAYKAIGINNSMQALESSHQRLLQVVLDQSQFRELTQRMKRFLPALTFMGTSVMAIAALDPSKIAPI
jgi:predicted ATPase